MIMIELNICHLTNIDADVNIPLDNNFAFIPLIISITTMASVNPFQTITHFLESETLRLLTKALNAVGSNCPTFWSGKPFR